MSRAVSSAGGDPASCSALGGCLLVAARRLESEYPELATALNALGSEVQRFAVSLRAVLIIGRYAASVPGLESGQEQPSAGTRATVQHVAAARRGRAEAALRRAALASLVQFESLTVSTGCAPASPTRQRPGTPGGPVTPAGHGP